MIDWVTPLPSNSLRIAAGACAATGVLSWRLIAVPFSSLWRDWPFLLAAYWISINIRDSSDSRRLLTLILMAYLLGIYAAGQIPQTLAVLSLAP